MEAVSVLDQERVRGMRARAQGLAGRLREDSVEAVLRRVFAIQAQDATAADLGIRVRGRNIDADDIRVAYEDERSIVRGWFMRGTLHTVAAADVRWILRLLAPRILGATDRRYRELGLDESLRERADRLIRRVLTAHGPLTRPELTEHLATLGIATHGQAPFHLIRHAALTGILCQGPRRAGEAGYVLLDDWLPVQPGVREPETDAALTELALRYLRAHGPVDAADFATWSGLPITWARTAWKALGRAGAITADGEPTGASDRGEGPAGTPSETPDVRMLPAYDNYLVGYRTRELSVPAAYEGRIRPGGGLIRPTVVVDGLAVATWTRLAAGRSVEVDAFEPLPALVEAGVAAERAEVIDFLRHGTCPPE
ncbi:winged helix DNA-binding domain-containing protein [Embleya scabrispora]|uniref:winged helix DNA-binding domain-containing protein n=1 Tax=Embleya scabrispora TaxID=159449 RepID=UPI000373340F|nr:winged helix DNA-binding domain-containing protein [Embleya scabrispora]